ncbi:MAG: hypothetical protein JWM98_295 [Thermoleophilia bacterium]|nr:hypothetical protein [Thermoleophilia bacterium]
MLIIRRRRTRARRRIGFGAVVAGAAALTLVVALAPSNEVSRKAHLPAPATAAAALRQAGDAAADAEWSPLGAMEYHHVLMTTFVPQVPARFHDPAKKISQLTTGFPPTATETWLDRTGKGMQLAISGGSGDPKEYPSISPDRNGDILGYGGTFDPFHDTMPSVTASLRYADQVRVTAWRRAGGKPTDGIWYRTAKGFIRGFAGPGEAVPTKGKTLGERYQLQHWGATLSQLERVDDVSTSQRAAAVRDLLDHDESYRANYPGCEFGKVGKLGNTKASCASETRIRRASQLLGTAPMSPASRKALFELLSRQPGATLQGSAKDELGRVGTRVTFEHIYDKREPTHVVTLAQLRHEAEASGMTVPAVIPGSKPSYTVAAGPAYRRWYLSVIFDPEAGELLQQEFYGRLESVPRQPRLQINNPNTGAGARVAFGADRQGILDAALYVTRERATNIVPKAEACAITPRMCR